MYNKELTISILLTHNCNELCSYCNSFSIHKNYHKSIEVDLHKLHQIKKILKDLNIRNIELTGGEIGLISNINDCIDIFKDFNINIPTNGLYFEHNYIRENIDYYFHFIKEIKDTQYYNHTATKIILNNSNVYNVIVGGIDMLKFILDNNFFLGSSYFELMLSKTYILEYKWIPNNGLEHYNSLFNLVHRKFPKLKSSNTKTPNNNNLKCSIQSKNIKLDLDTMRISQCVHIDDVWEDFTYQKLKKHLNAELFKFNPKCLDCTTFQNINNINNY